MDTYRSSRVRTRATWLTAFLVGSALWAVSPAFAGSTALVASENQFDFGHAGRDFKLFRSFSLRNQGKSPIILHSANVVCECTSVQIMDTSLAPGESTAVRVTLDTYSLFGQSTKSFTISTGDQSAPAFEYTYQSVVDQWPFGLKPEPLSVFFLPGQPAKRVVIANRALERVEIFVADQADTTYTVNILKSQATKGERVEVEVTPKGSLRAGTYLSSFRLSLKVPGDKPPVMLNIPVKIVRY
jgi:hypothetical protein